MSQYPLALTPVEILTQYAWPLLQFLIGLGLVVIVHELGHFLAAKWAGIKVEEFAVGFGKKIWGVQRGETLYRVNAVPLGGYVKMLGQDDMNPAATAEGDPRSWQAATARKKMVVLAAGVAMNVLFALVVFVIVYLVGIRFSAPVIGAVQADMPAAQAGLKSGDVIQAINGKPIRKFQQLLMLGILSGPGQEFDFQVARDEGGQTKVFHVTLVPKEIADPNMGAHYAFGIGQANSLILEKADESGYAGSERFKSGDTIVAIDGTPVRGYWELDDLLSAYAGKNVPVIVDRGGKRVTVETLPPDIRSNLQQMPGLAAPQSATGSAGAAAHEKPQEMLTLLGMSSPLEITSVIPKTTAQKAHLEPGDVLFRYGNIDYPSWAEVREVNKQSADKPVSVKVRRGDTTELTTVTPQREEGAEYPVIGVGLVPAQNVLTVSSVADGSPAAQAGIAKESELVSIDGTDVKNWSQAYRLLAAKQGGQAKIAYTLDGQSKTATLTVPAGSLNPDSYHFDLPPLDSGKAEIRPLLTPPVRGDPLQAIIWSAEDTRDWVVQSYQTLARIFQGRVSAKGVAGPVGMSQIAITVVKKSFIDFIYFMAMLSSMLAVMNFLPWPALDGGHFVIVLVEKARGKPLPVKVMTGIQMAGILILLAVFLMVTFNDILRWVKS